MWRDKTNIKKGANYNIIYDNKMNNNNNNNNNKVELKLTII